MLPKAGAVQLCGDFSRVAVRMNLCGSLQSSPRLVTSTSLDNENLDEFKLCIPKLFFKRAEEHTL